MRSLPPQFFPFPCRLFALFFQQPNFALNPQPLSLNNHDFTPTDISPANHKSIKSASSPARQHPQNAIFGNCVIHTIDSCTFDAGIPHAQGSAVAFFASSSGVGCRGLQRGAGEGIPSWELHSAQVKPKSHSLHFSHGLGCLFSWSFSALAPPDARAIFGRTPLQHHASIPQPHFQAELQLPSSACHQPVSA